MARVMKLVNPEYFDEIPDPATIEDVHGGDVVSLDHVRVRSYVSKLPSRERDVITLRFGLSGRTHTIAETAKCLRLGVGTVHRAEKRALDLLRGMYGIPADEPGDAPSLRIVA